MRSWNGCGVFRTRFENLRFFDGIFFDFEDEVAMDAMELER